MSEPTVRGREALRRGKGRGARATKHHKNWALRVQERGQPHDHEASNLHDRREGFHAGDSRDIRLGSAWSGGPTRRGEDSERRVIIEWNQLLQQNLAGPPQALVRPYAMLHIAMADAVVAVEGRYDPYHVRMSAPQGASAEAAAAQAGHDILVALIPAAQAQFDTALQTRLATITPGLRMLGVQVGKKVAAAVLAWRQNDGSATANPQPPDFLASTSPVSGTDGLRAGEFSRFGEWFPSAC